MANSGDAVLRFKAAQKLNFSEANIRQSSLDELNNPGSLQELEEILSKIDDENPYSKVLFKGKYLFLIWDDFLAYQKPLGDVYKKCIAVFIAKKRISTCKYRVNTIVQYLKTKLSFLYPGRILFGRSRNHSSTQAFVTVCENYGIYPMPESIGRKILEMCLCICLVKIKLPFVCVCHHGNSKAEIVLGSSIAKGSRVSIRKKGRIRKQELLPTLTELKESHLEGLPSVSSIYSSVLTYYEFLEYVPKEKNELIPILGTALSIESKWSNVLAVLEPLQPDCKTLVKVQAKTGNDLSGAYNLHQELAQIEYYHKCMEEHSEMNIGKSTSIIEKIKQFMIEQKPTRPEKCPMFVNQIIKEEKSLNLFDDVVLNQRIDLDFTEKLWLILKDVSSVTEMNKAFEIFYTVLAEYTYSPCICCESVSTIALNIRKLEQSGMMRPVLNDSLMYKLLIEIGIEKIRKDYLSIFVGLGILTFDSLKYFFEPDLLSENAVKRLRKLHSILEFTIVCIKRLSLPKEILSIIIRDTLKKYENDEIDDDHEFTFFIPPVKARSLLNQMRPVLWELSLVTRCNDKIKQTIHRYTTTPTQMHIIAPEKHHPKVMLKTASYTYWNGLFVQDVYQDE